MSTRVEIERRLSSTGDVDRVTVRVVDDGPVSRKVLAECHDTGEYAGDPDDDDPMSPPSEERAARAAVDQMRRQLADARRMLSRAVGVDL